MVTGAETAEQMSTSFQLERSFTSSPLLWFCLTTKNELRDITSDTQIVSSGEKTLKHKLPAALLLVCGDKWVTSSLCVSVSLAIHPDKIRIATGQIAGVDKDGRVWTNMVYKYGFTEVNVMLKCEAGRVYFIYKKIYCWITYVDNQTFTKNWDLNQNYDSFTFLINN